ncbi:MAG TPA: hypothetical protein VFC30_01160 [Solirubrobacteraceae bacterium]|nr:hypothetical protein [Solirubrobacteraceae bacterium]
MSPIQSPSRTRSRTRAPALRLQHGERITRPYPLREYHDPPPVATVDDGPTRVLLVGSDAGRRATLLDELTRALPSSTVFEELDAVSEVLEQAPGSRMVFLTGNLDDTPAVSLMQLLGRRHPDLPVVSLEAPALTAL